MNFIVANNTVFLLQNGLFAFGILIFAYLIVLFYRIELAFFQISETKVIFFKQQINQQFAKHLFFVSHPKKLSATVFLTNLFLNICLLSLLYFAEMSWLMAVIKQEFVPYIWVLINAFFLILLKVVLPRMFRINSNETMLERWIPLVYYLQKILSPLVFWYEKIFQIKGKSNAKNQIFAGNENHTSSGNETDSKAENRIVDDEINLLKGIANFNETEVSEIMHSRVDIAAIDETASFSEVLKFIDEIGYSRFPVFSKNIDQIVGVLHIKDFLNEIETVDYPWKSQLRPALFVPENKKIKDLLQEFKQKKQHLAIVVNEYGGTQGLVTLEDVLEEIVGEISDEFDSENQLFVYNQMDKNKWVFEAKTSLIDFCKLIGFPSNYFDEIKGEFDSLAGLILELKGDFPIEGEQLSYKNIRFKIIKLEERRISRVFVETLMDANHEKK